MQLTRKSRSAIIGILLLLCCFVSPFPSYGASYNTVFIGDSRTVGMYASVCNKTLMSQSIDDVVDNNRWIAQTSSGLSYAQNAWSKAKSGVSKSTTKVVLLSGVNDLGNQSGYQALLASMKNEVDNVYFVSVNPVIDGRGWAVTNSMISSFNSSMKSFCESNGIGYIDTASRIQSDVAGNTSDGLHYNGTLYQKIYTIISSYADGTATGPTTESHNRNQEASEPVRELAPGDDDESNAFSDDPNEVKKMYMTRYGWDYNKAKVRYWTNDINGSKKEFERQAGWQEEFLGDNIKTTKQYLGLNSKSGSKKGGGGADVVSAAVAEVGKEDSIEAPLGSDNVKYNTWYYGKEITDGNHPWNGVFVSWVMEKADLIETGFWKKMSSVSEMYKYVTNTMGFKVYNADATTPFGGNSYTPVAGDLMFFKEGNTATHVGIITQVSSNGWYTVEGDVEDKVQKIHYSADDPSAVENAVVVAMEYPAAEYEGGTSEQNAKTIYDFCINELGYNSAAACGVVANAEEESGCMPDIHQVGGPAYGIFQWDDRKNNLYSWCEQNNMDSSTLEAQLWFMKYECETTERAAHQLMLNIPNTVQGAYDAAYTWCVKWERPANMYSEGESRGRLAQTKYWPLYGD